MAGDMMLSGPAYSISVGKKCGQITMNALILLSRTYVTGQ